MTLVLGIVGYALLIAAAVMVTPVLGVATAGVICLYLSFANQPRRP